jgi:hypothetical protein
MFRLPAMAAVPAAAVLLALVPGSADAATCNLSATPSTFASQVSAASAGQTICLASGSYGTWSGTAKTITITPATGATPIMRVSFASGDSGFTLDGLSGMGGRISAGAKNITIRNSNFTDQLDVEGATSNVVLDGDHFNWNAVSNGGINSKLFIDTSGTLSAPALTVRNSTFLNGDLDGIHVGGGSGDQIVGNEFGNLCDRNVNHTDNLQFEGGTQIRIAGNYVHAAQNCPTQGITSYDGGTNGVIIEDNVVDVPRDWGIELYSDKNSVIRHNTVVYHPKTYSEFKTGTGQIDIDRKSADPAGTGTQVYDNLALGVSFSNGSSGTQHNNVANSAAAYVGPVTSYAGFRLTTGSPVGLRAASDGLDAGARVANYGPAATPGPAPAPSPAPTAPADTPAKATWTAPTGVKVGTPVVLDGTRSTGDGPLSCTWSFENADGSIIWETISGCKITKTFKAADTKYVKLIVKDADGDTATSKKSFAAAAA